MKKTYIQPTSMNEAVQMCTQMVNKVAHKWKRNHYWMFQDLQQAGLMGVCEAWERFSGSDHEKQGYRFTSYAWWWIRLRIKEEAERSWGYLNNTASEEAMVYGDIEYELNDRMISVLREIDKLPKEDREMYQMRIAGFSFQEIADEVGAKSLHKVRNHLIKINEKLESV